MLPPPPTFPSHPQYVMWKSQSMVVLNNTKVAIGHLYSYLAFTTAANESGSKISD